MANMIRLSARARSSRGPSSPLLFEPDQKQKMLVIVTSHLTDSAGYSEWRLLQKGGPWKDDAAPGRWGHGVFEFHEDSKQRFIIDLVGRPGWTARQFLDDDRFSLNHIDFEGNVYDRILIMVGSNRP